MSTIKRLEEMRDHITAIELSGWDGHKTTWVRQDSLLIYLDAMEQEVAERFMELPVDADGVPIRCGDRMRLDSGHEGEVWLIGAQDIMMSDHTCFDWAMSHHAKPRTVEDVLKELEGMRGNGATYEDVVARCSELADELRGLIGGTHE